MMHMAKLKLYNRYETFNSSYKILSSVASYFIRDWTLELFLGSRLRRDELLTKRPPALTLIPEKLH